MFVILGSCHEVPPTARTEASRPEVRAEPQAPAPWLRAPPGSSRRPASSAGRPIESRPDGMCRSLIGALYQSGPGSVPESLIRALDMSEDRFRSNAPADSSAVLGAVAVTARVTAAGFHDKLKAFSLRLQPGSVIANQKYGNLLSCQYDILDDLLEARLRGLWLELGQSFLAAGVGLEWLCTSTWSTVFAACQWLRATLRLLRSFCGHLNHPPSQTSECCPPCCALPTYPLMFPSTLRSYPHPLRILFIKAIVSSSVALILNDSHR